jgi:hypothetical protein
MFKKIISMCLGAIICQGAVMAQNVKQFPVFALRTNPLSLLENDANIMLGLGVHLSPRIAVSVEPGWVLYTLYNAEDDVPPAKGLKLRTDLRYFLRDFVPMGSNRFAPFVALEFHYKNVTQKKTDDFGINCVNGDCEYYQQGTYNLRKKETGGLAKFGAVFPLSRRGRFNGEFFMGIGARTQKFTYKNTPMGSTVFFDPVDPSADFPYIPLNDSDNAPTLLFASGIKFLYFLGKR